MRNLSYGREREKISTSPFALPLIGESEIDEVVDTLKSEWLTTRPKTKRFEQLFQGISGRRTLWR